MIKILISKIRDLLGFLSVPCCYQICRKEFTQNNMRKYNLTRIRISLKFALIHHVLLSFFNRVCTQQLT